MNKIRITTDDADCPDFAAFDDGLRWNGWLAPLVARETLDQILALYPDVSYSEGPEFTYRFLYRIEGATFYDATADA